MNQQWRELVNPRVGRAWFGARVWLSGPRVHRGCRRPSFGFLHPSLCASSLRRSLALIHDNADMQTHSHQAGISLHAAQLHQDTQVPTPTLWPPWSHIPSPAGDLIRVLFHAGSISRFTYSPFLCLCTLSPVFWQPQPFAPTHPSPGLLISRCHQRFVQGEAGKRRPRGPRTQ